MTAVGSEEIAVKALKKGAASYVPKKNLERDIAETLSSVISVAQASGNQQRLLECLARTELQFVLGNDPSLVPTLIGHLDERITTLQRDDGHERVRVGVAIHEAIVNAIYHGNLEVSSDLRQED